MDCCLPAAAMAVPAPERWTGWAAHFPANRSADPAALATVGCPGPAAEASGARLDLSADPARTAAVAAHLADHSAGCSAAVHSAAVHSVVTAAATAGLVGQGFAAPAAGSTEQLARRPAGLA